MSSQSTHAKILSGLLFIIIGGVLLLRNLSLIPPGFPGYIFTWPMILIIIGCFNLVGKKDKTAGFILISIGLFFLLPNALGVPTYQIFKFWPVLLIVAGISFLLKQKNYGGYKRLEMDHSRGASEMGLIEVTSFFGGSQKVLDPMEFRGGSVSSIFGGNEIDLTQCVLAEGVNRIDLTVLFGGAVLIVPADWNVQVEVNPILGGFSDERFNNPTIFRDPERVLVIKGIAIFGGGVLKSR